MQNNKNYYDHCFLPRKNFNEIWEAKYNVETTEEQAKKNLFFSFLAYIFKREDQNNG